MTPSDLTADQWLEHLAPPTPKLSTVELVSSLVGVPEVRFKYRAPIRHGGEIRGHVFSLRTEHRDLEVYISQTGRSVRVWDETAGRELK